MYSLTQGIDQQGRYFTIRKGDKGIKQYRSLNKLKKTHDIKCKECGEIIGLNTKMYTEGPISSKPDALTYYCKNCFTNIKVANKL